MTTTLLVIAGMATAIMLIKLLSGLSNHKSTPTPRKSEYLAAYPERVESGSILCSCGSSNLSSTGTPSGNADTFIICICKSCHKILYSTSAYDKNPTKTEAVA